MKIKLYRIGVPLFFFLFTIVVHFVLTDFAVYRVESQWEEVSLTSHIVNHFTNKNIYLGYSYAIASAFASLCLLNLITASGGLKQSIRGITISAILWGTICFMSGCCGSPMLAVYLSLFGSAVVGVTKPITAAITTLSIALSYYYVLRFNSKNLVYTVSKESALSEKNNPFAEVKRYKAPHPIIRGVKTLLMTLFRLFPNPIPLGLYAFGNPDKNSPLMVTTNYELTMYRVSDVLKDLDCYLLVVDGKGINVWCSAGAGHFTVQSILDGIQLSPVNELLAHRKLILPQFAGVGICCDELRERSGWSPRFGPVYIRDIKAYLDGNMKKSDAMHDAEFGLIQRIEMAVGATFIYIFVLVCVMLFINVQALLILIPVVYLQSILYGIISPRFPFKSGLLIGSSYALCTALLLFLSKIIFGIGSLSTQLTYGIPLIIAAFYLPNEFMGWSPLIKYNMKMILIGRWEAEISVDAEKCTGCGLCVSVCPVKVFELTEGQSKIINIANCEGCKACYYQCPDNAITHSLQGEDDKCACLYCNIQDSVGNEQNNK